MTAPVPFHISFVAESAEVMTAFARFAPPVGGESGSNSGEESSAAAAKLREKVRVLLQRRSSCDVKSV